MTRYSGRVGSALASSTRSSGGSVIKEVIENKIILFLIIKIDTIFLLTI